jgi:acyl-CoA synthetase (AMP-forming)/AMP-acid ligase II
LIGFERSEIEGTIPARFRRVADAIPDHLAVRTPDGCITFAELDSESDRVAGNLLRLRGPIPEPIAIMLAPGIPALTAMLGCLKAGKMFVVLSHDADPALQAVLWKNSLRPPIFTDPEYRPQAALIAASDDLLLDVHQKAQFAFDPSPVHNHSDTPAMLTFSSGSTSTPKGVVSTHRMILHSTWFYSDRHGYSERDRITYLGAYSSSHAMSYNLYSILCGSTLVLPPEAHRGSFAYIEWLEDEKISILSITSLGLFQQHLRACADRPPLPELREITIGGQEFTRPELEELRRYFPPEIMFIFRLASSDANQISELWIRPHSEIPWEKLPVGHAVPGKEILLLDETRQPVPIGDIGEIAIRSRYLAPGYWGLPELTRERFLPDPEGGDLRIFLTGDQGRFLPDGMLEFRGRKDNLVRIHNQNVQLEEVEKRLLQAPGVREAAALVTPWPDGGKRLTAYIVTAPGADLTVDSLRQYLGDFLAPHMIPTLYVFMDSLPRLSSGKIDRSNLPPPAGARPRLSAPYQPPRDKVEAKLCALWSELLQIAPVGVNDDFYHLGGDSLLVLSMSLAVEQAFGRTIPPSYFRRVTVAGLARLWEEEDTAAGSPAQPAAAVEPESAAVQSTPHQTKFASPKKDKRAIARPNRAISFATYLAMQMPYEPACRWVALFCRLPAMRSHFLRDHARLFRQFRSALGGCPDAPPDAELINLAGNILWSSHARAGMGVLADQDSMEGMRASPTVYWRSLARLIDEAPPERFDRLFRVYGWEHLERAFDAGGGVILVSFHSTANRIASCGIYRRLRSQPIQTMSQQRARGIENLRQRDNPSAEPERDDVALISDLLMKGYRTLKRGQIVQIVPDGRDFSAQDDPQVIGGRKTFLQSGFAKLALLADAVVIPVASTRRLDGSIHSTFFPPLVPQDVQAPLEGKIRSLVSQYAVFLDHSWHIAPESLRWTKMAKFLEWPAAEKKFP